jgi:hypothetical protein
MGLHCREAESLSHSPWSSFCSFDRCFLMKPKRSFMTVRACPSSSWSSFDMRFRFPGGKKLCRKMGKLFFRTFESLLRLFPLVDSGHGSSARPPERNDEDRPQSPYTGAFQSPPIHIFANRTTCYNLQKYSFVDR